MTTLFNPNSQATADAEVMKAQKAFTEAATQNQAETVANRNKVTEDGTYRRFKNALPSCNFIFKDGTVGVFKNGEYLTNNPQRIKELETEVANGHPHISIVQGEYVVDPDDLDPEKRDRKKWFKIFQEEQEAAQNRDMGSTDKKSDLNVANSKTVGQAIANGAGSLAAVPTGLMAALQSQSSGQPG